MEARKVTVQVIGTQRLLLDGTEGDAAAGGRTEAEGNMEQTLPGVYSFRNGKHFVVYEEDSEAGPTRSTVKIAESGFEVVKTGAGSARLTFRAGGRCRCRYDTPFGGLLAVFDVRRVEVCLPEADEAGEDRLLLSAKACYVLELSGQTVSENVIEIRVFEQI